MKTNNWKRKDFEGRFYCIDEKIPEERVLIEKKISCSPVCVVRDKYKDKIVIRLIKYDENIDEQNWTIQQHCTVGEIKNGKIYLYTTDKQEKEEYAKLLNEYL